MNRYSGVVMMIILLVLTIDRTNVFSQGNQDRPWVVTTMELALPENGSIAEFDSLNQLYTDKVIKKNDLILNFRTLRHWWGKNNRDYIVMYEVKSWADIIAANEKMNELFKQAWPTKEAQDKFNKAYNKYFTGKHSDEIYSEVMSSRK